MEITISKLIIVVVCLSLLFTLILNAPIEKELTFEVREPFITKGEYGYEQLMVRRNVTQIKITNLLEMMGWKE